MTDDIICPFYAQDEDLCDVGCGYISPSDVRQIIRHCRAHHHDCTKYQELATRFPDQAAAAPQRRAISASARAAIVIADSEKKPARHLDQHRAVEPEEPGSSCDGCSSDGSAGVMSLATATANPMPLGLFGFGMTTALFSLNQTASFPFDPLILAVGLFYGGLAQIIAGILAWRRNSLFDATSFTSYGLFWLTLVGLMVFPRAGIGHLPSSLAMVSYLTLWGMFSTVMAFAALPVGRLLTTIFGFLALFFFGLALGEAASASWLVQAAGWIGLVCGVLAGYTGFAQVINDVYRRRILPC